MTEPAGSQLTRSPAELEGEARLRRLQEIGVEVSRIWPSDRRHRWKLKALIAEAQRLTDEAQAILAAQPEGRVERVGAEADRILAAVHGEGS